MKQGKLLVISGFSAGSGKDTLINMFLERHTNWHWPPSTTTRQPRPGEEHGQHMNFISQAEFENWRREGRFLESDFHAGNWYGTLKEPVLNFLNSGKNVVLRLDVNGSLQIKAKMPTATIVFIDVENHDELEARIRGRGTENEAEIRSRLALAKREQKFKTHFDCVVLNARNKHKQTLQQLEKAAGL